MMSISANVLDELLKLPADKRAEIAHVLWESLTDIVREAEFSLTADQTAELHRGVAEDDANPDSGIPWEIVKQALKDCNGRSTPSSIEPVGEIRVYRVRD
jgi:putative addiction module component (TIGR02574 family)